MVAECLLEAYGILMVNLIQAGGFSPVPPGQMFNC
jgi:hypothetical protein